MRRKDDDDLVILNKEDIQRDMVGFLCHVLIKNPLAAGYTPGSKTITEYRIL